MGDTNCDVFILFKRFDDQCLRQLNSLLWDLNSSWPLQLTSAEVNYCSDPIEDYVTDEGVDRRNVWKNKNIFVSPIASSVNHWYAMVQDIITDHFL